MAENDLISRKALIVRLAHHHAHSYGNVESAYGLAVEEVQNAPSVEAEPVRHEGDTTYITTNDLDKYQDMIIVDEGEKSKFCHVYYADDREHGRWTWITEDIYRCENCGERVHVKEVMGRPDWDYCPSCGAKMDGITVKPEECRYFTKNALGARCLGTKEIDPCEGKDCKRYKPKEDA